MKPVFDEEVARSLGYQKYWPELHDWVIAIIATLVVTLAIVGLIFIIFGPK